MTQEKKQLYMRWIFILLSLVWMGVIFFLSAQTSTESGETSGSLSVWIQKIFYPSFSNLSPEDYEEEMLCLDAIVRKIGHCTEFFILGMLYGMVAIQIKGSWWKRFFCAVGIGFLYALSDEIHQHFVPGRFMTMFDVIIDGIGVFFGNLLIFGTFAIRLVSRKSEDAERNKSQKHFL